MLSPELQERYQSEVDVDWRHVYVFSHSRAGSIHIINHPDMTSVIAPNGVLTDFLPIPVLMSFPSRDDSGTYEFSLTVCGVQAEGKAFVDKAYQSPDEPIKCQWSVVILGEVAPQIDPWVELDLTDITLSSEGLMATASRVDILNRAFPREVYRLSKFPGLRRQ